MSHTVPTAGLPSVGDVVYLVPRSLGCPTEAWRSPRVVIVEINPRTATVRLLSANSKPYGRRITTARTNIRRELPKPPRERPTPAPKPEPQPTAWHQPALWAVREVN